MTRPWPTRATPPEGVPVPTIVCDDCDQSFTDPDPAQALRAFRRHPCPPPEAALEATGLWADKEPSFQVHAFIDTDGARCGQVVVQMKVWCRRCQGYVPRHGDRWAMTTADINRSVQEHLDTAHQPEETS